MLPHIGLWTPNLYQWVKCMGRLIHILNNGLMDWQAPSSEKSTLLKSMTPTGTLTRDNGLCSMGLSMHCGSRTWIPCLMTIWLYAWPTARESNLGHNWECYSKYKICQLPLLLRSVGAVWSIYHLITYIGGCTCRVGFKSMWIENKTNNF